MKEYKGPRYWFRYLEIVSQIKPFAKGKQVLEIGSGTLEMASLLAKSNRITALDLSSDLDFSLKKLPEKLQRNIKCIEGDFLEYDFGEEKFDIIIAMDVLEHIEKEGEFLKKVKDLSNKSSLVVISVPAHTRLWSKHDEAVGHIRRYKKRDIERIKGRFNPTRFLVSSYGWPWVNLLRYLRILTTPFIYKNSENYSNKERSVNSGKRINKLNFLRFLVNKYTIFPFWLISKLFVNCDWSGGYVVFIYNE